MQKTQLTLRLTPIMHITLEKMKEEKGLKSVNLLIVDLLEREILKQQKESDLLNEIDKFRQDITNGMEILGQELLDHRELLEEIKQLKGSK